jgi:hypothetical protein
MTAPTERRWQVDLRATKAAMSMKYDGQDGRWSPAVSAAIFISFSTRYSFPAGS